MKYSFSIKLCFTSYLYAFIGGNTENSFLFFSDKQVEDRSCMPAKHSCGFACYVRVPHTHDAVHTCVRTLSRHPDSIYGQSQLCQCVLPPVTIMFWRLQKSKHLTPLYTLKTTWSLGSLCLGCSQAVGCFARAFSCAAFGSRMSFSCWLTSVLPMTQPVQVRIMASSCIVLCCCVWESTVPITSAVLE